MRAVRNLLVINLLRAVAVLVLVCAIDTLRPGGASAQEINFDQINKFESLGTGTLHVGAPPKRLSVMASGTSLSSRFGMPTLRRRSIGAPRKARTTIIPGKGIQTFQTAGEFKVEAIGEPNREVNYGYVLLGLRK
jgi:hypothetical protein